MKGFYNNVSLQASRKRTMPKALLLLAVVLLAARLGRTQQPNDSLTAGQSLLDGQTLVSAQGIFTLGFFPNGDNTYLGIWYNNMKPRTVVWVANRDAPIKGGNGSLTLSTNSLDLLDRRGNIVWSRSRFSTNSPQAVSSTTLCHQGLQIHYGKVLLSPVTHCCLV